MFESGSRLSDLIGKSVFVVTDDGDYRGVVKGVKGGGIFIYGDATTKLERKNIIQENVAHYVPWSSIRVFTVKDKKPGVAQGGSEGDEVLPQ